VFGTNRVGAAEVQVDLGDPKLVRHRAAADVDGTAERIVEQELDVMSGVLQSSAHLKCDVVTGY